MTKPCPACATELELPTQFLDAVKNIRESSEKFTEAIQLDYLHYLHNNINKQAAWEAHCITRISTEDTKSMLKAYLDTLIKIKREKNNATITNTKGRS